MSTQAHPKPVSQLPHRIAALLTAIVFPLIWVGGLVTTYDAGMAVPDWPNTYNYNLFAYPVRDWFFGPWDLFVEHGHRLLGSLAGILAIVLVVVTWIKEPRRWVRWYAVGLLVLVIGQGILGGMRVLMDERTLAKIHGCVGPGFFAAAVGFCVITSRWWRSRETGQIARKNMGSRKIAALIQWPVVMLLLCYLQLAFGALLRHISITSSPSEYQTLVVVHVVTAVLIVAGTIAQWFMLNNSTYADQPGLASSITILCLLVVAQFGLGLGTWVVKYGWPVWFENIPFAASFVVAEKTFWQMNIVTAHVATGSLLLAFWMIHSLRFGRVKYTMDEASRIDVDDDTRPNLELVEA